MIVHENQCCDCQLPCIGKSCPLIDVPVRVCDWCGEYADYEIDNQDFCEKCAKDYVEQTWDALSLMEKTELLELGGKIL